MVFGLLIADLGLKTGFFWFMMFMVIHPTMGIQQECIYIYIYSTMKRDRWPSPKDKVHHGISSSLWLKLVIFLYNYVYNIVFIFIQSIYTVYIYVSYMIYVCMYIPIHIPFTDEESLCFNGWFQGVLLQVKGQNLGCRLKVSATAPNAPRCHRSSKRLGVDFWVDWLDTNSMARTLVSLVSGAVNCSNVLAAS